MNRRSATASGGVANPTLEFIHKRWLGNVGRVLGDLRSPYLLPCGGKHPLGLLEQGTGYLGVLVEGVRGVSNGSLAFDKGPLEEISFCLDAHEHRLVTLKGRKFRIFLSALAKDGRRGVDAVRERWLRLTVTGMGARVATMGFPSPTGEQDLPIGETV